MTGTSSAGTSGSLNVYTGQSTGGKGGDMILSVGTGNTGSGGDMAFSAGKTTDTNRGGNIILQTGYIKWEFIFINSKCRCIWCCRRKYVCVSWRSEQHTD